MLIISKKHTKIDLELWSVYEEMDKINSKSDKLKYKEDKAIEIIKDFSKRKQCYIGISWGKDSVTVVDLALRNNIDIPIIHLYCIQLHNKESDKVRDTFLKLYPNIQYTEIIIDYGNLPLCFHDEKIDKKTDIIWYNGFKEAEKRFGDCHISGVRKEESGKRRLRMRMWGLESIRTLAPIGYWKNEDVFAYLNKYNLPVHPNYAMLGNGKWNRKNIRVADIGEPEGSQYDRETWEKEYYNAELKQIRSAKEDKG